MYQKIASFLRNRKRVQSAFKTLGFIAIAIFCFLLSIDLIGLAFKNLGETALQAFLSATNNPFVGLFIGLLVTAIIQSSSTTTSMVVAVVAAGSLSLDNAIPIVIGANIGTTLTSTLVSLNYITRKNEFSRAISAGTSHDFFNILVATFIFPLEYFFQLLTKASVKLSMWISPSISENDVSSSFQLPAIAGLSNWIRDIIPYNFLVLFVAFLLLFGSIKLVSKVIYKVLMGRQQENLAKNVFDHTYKAFGWGVLSTAALQSSSVTTSLTVPLVAKKKVSLQKLFPYILGANMGTTLTALLAALFKSETAISLALTHLIFNLVGIMLFLPFPWLRRIPIAIALKFGDLTLKNKLLGFLYIIFTFFLIPFLLIYFSL